MSVNNEVQVHLESVIKKLVSKLTDLTIEWAAVSAYADGLAIKVAELERQLEKGD